jgi:hypothetical protein
LVTRERGRNWRCDVAEERKPKMVWLLEGKKKKIKGKNKRQIKDDSNNAFKAFIVKNNFDFENLQ